MVDREAGKAIAPGTPRNQVGSLVPRYPGFVHSDSIEFCFPPFVVRRIAVAWCRKHGVLIENIFSETLSTKCAWNLSFV